MKHARCNGEMWVCEAHPNKPQGHHGCMVPGMPCDCNPCDEFNPPRANFDVAVEYPDSPWRKGAYRPTARPTLKPLESDTEATFKEDQS